MNEEDVLLKMFKALSDKNRINIVMQLKDGEKCACVLLEHLKIEQPTLSHHMKLLCDASIVQARKQGKWTHYSINKEGCKFLVNFIVDVTDCCQNLYPRKQCKK